MASSSGIRLRYARLDPTILVVAGPLGLQPKCPVGSAACTNGTFSGHSRTRTMVKQSEELDNDDSKDGRAHCTNLWIGGNSRSRGMLRKRDLMVLLRGKYGF